MDPRLRFEILVGPFSPITFFCAVSDAESRDAVKRICESIPPNLRGSISRALSDWAATDFYAEWSGPGDNRTDAAKHSESLKVQAALRQHHEAIGEFLMGPYVKQTGARLE